MGRPKKKPNALNSTQREILRRRGMDPRNYELVKALYGSLYVRDTRTGKVIVINKQN